MKVATRLRGAFLIYIALLAGVVAYHVRTIQHAVASGRTLTNISSRLHASSSQQVARVEQVHSDVLKYAATRDSGYLYKALDSAKVFGDELDSLSELSLTIAEQRLLKPLSAHWEAVASRLPPLKRIAAASDKVAHDTAVSVGASLDEIRLETEQLAFASQEALRSELTTSEAAATAAERLSLLAAVGALLLSGVLSALLLRSIMRPLERLTEGTHEVSAGRFTHRLDASGGDEFAQVARDFNSMTERLDELDRMKRDFVAKVSHDLKTPLSSMQETISVLLDGVAGPVSPKQRHLLELNLESGQRLSAMLTKLLDLSRIEAGLEADMQMLDLLSLVKRSIDRADTARAERSFRLSLVEPEHRVLVRGDESGLSQVLDNLLENAIKFSPVGGAIVVRVNDQLSGDDRVPKEHASVVRGKGLRGTMVDVSVSDEGPGIPDDEKERVFTRFYQAEAGRAARGRGVGLGLTICREIVAAHGGAIWAADNEPRGTTFHVLLPGVVRAPGHAAKDFVVPAMAMMILMIAGCAPPPFEQYYSQGRWLDAVHVFDADSSLLNNERALYQMGALFSSTTRGSYDPDRARVLLQRLLARFPASTYRADAIDRLALLDAVSLARDSAAIRRRDVEARIAELNAEAQRLRAARDSALARGDSLQRSVAKFEADLRDRDEQLRVLRQELARLKEIDLKPRPPVRPP